MKDKKILITGGAGAIGSNLARRLSQDNQIIILDDLSSGYLENIHYNENVNFIRGCITSKHILDKIFEETIDIVFHLAAFFANQNSIDHPKQDLMTNALGTLNLLECARDKGIEKFFYASSSCLGEEILDTPYALTKKLGEEYCSIFHDIFKVPITTLRYYNSYGPGEFPGKYRNVIPNFIFLALKGEDLIITGSGQETRDFTFIEDVIDFTIKAAECKELEGGYLDLGTGIETDIQTLAEKIIEITNSKSKIIYKPKRVWDRVKRRICPVRKIQGLFGVCPEIILEEGLPITISWLEKHLIKNGKNLKLSI